MVDPLDPWYESKLRFAEIDLRNQRAHVEGDAYCQELLKSLKAGDLGGQEETKILEAIVARERRRQQQIAEDAANAARGRHNRARFKRNQKAQGGSAP